MLRVDKSNINVFIGDEMKLARKQFIQFISSSQQKTSQGLIKKKKKILIKDPDSNPVAVNSFLL